MKNAESMNKATLQLENVLREKLSINQRQQFVGWTTEKNKWDNLMDSNVFDTATKERFRKRPQLIMAVTIGVALMGLGDKPTLAFRYVPHFAYD